MVETCSKLSVRQSFRYYLTNIQLTPCTCMLVISSELLSVIQRLNHRMSFMFISNHRQLKRFFFCYFCQKLQSLDNQDIAVGAAYQFSGFCEAA